MIHVSKKEKEWERIVIDKNNIHDDDDVPKSCTRRHAFNWCVYVQMCSFNSCLVHHQYRNVYIQSMLLVRAFKRSQSQIDNHSGRQVMIVAVVIIGGRHTTYCRCCWCLLNEKRMKMLKKVYSGKRWRTQPKRNERNRLSMFSTYSDIHTHTHKLICSAMSSHRFEWMNELADNRIGQVE